MTIIRREGQPASRPVGRVEVGDFRFVDRTGTEPGAGEILVRNLWISVDAALRVRLDASTPPGCLSPLVLHEPPSR